MNRKRVIAGILTIVMIITLLPLTVFAGETETKLPAEVPAVEESGKTDAEVPAVEASAETDAEVPAEAVADEEPDKTDAEDSAEIPTAAELEETQEEASNEAMMAAQGETAPGNVPEGETQDYATLLQSDVITKEEAINLAKGIVSSAINGDPAGAAQTVLKWGAGKLIESIFGPMFGEGEKEATLQDVLYAIDMLNAAISELQTTVDSQQLDDILNSLKPLISYKTTYDVYAAIKDINDKQAAGTYSDDEAKRRVQSELTTSLGNGKLDDIASLATVGNQSSFDRFAELIWSAMTDKYHVTISGKTKDLTLMQIWYEHLRYKYRWEHMAYDEWASFQSQCVTLLATTLTLEKASLQTRIELIRKWNEEHPDQVISEGSCVNRLKTVQDHINQMTGYQGKGVNDEEVNYPGIFSEETWEKTYWLYKERPDYRYYWVPGHECLFRAQLGSQSLPREREDGGLLNHPDGLNVNVQWTGYSYLCTATPTNFWMSFFEPDGPGGVQMVSEDQLKKMYKDYDKYDSKRYSEHPHLYDIFIKKDEGNFLGLDETGIKTWWFPVYPDGDNPVYYERSSDTTGEARFHSLTSAHANRDTNKFCAYYLQGAKPNNPRHIICALVVRYGPEPEPDEASVLPPEEKQSFTAMISSSTLWWPGLGDLTIAYDNATHGSVLSATMDGTEINASSYKTDDGKIILTDAFMRSLSFGEHELVLTTEHGRHTVTFWTKAAAYRVAEGADQEYQQGSGGTLTFVFKRSENDAEAISHFTGVKHGDNLLTRDKDYTAKSGSVVIELQAAFLKTLEVGEHTLTVMFDDGDPVEVTFKVIAADKTKPASNTTPSQKSPATGDNQNVLLWAVLVLAALAGIIMAMVLMLKRRKQ